MPLRSSLLERQTPARSTSGNARVASTQNRITATHPEAPAALPGSRPAEHSGRLGARDLRSLLPFALGLVLALAGADVRAEWPRWRGPGNDGHASATEVVLTNLPAQPAVRWKVEAGEGLSSPVVAHGRVLAFDNQAGKETLRALNAADGVEVWRAEIDEPFSDTQGPTGPRNTPVIDGDLMYAVSCRGELQCRRLADGARVWSTHYVRDFGSSFIGEKGNAPGASRHGHNASPLVDGEHLLACVGGTNGAGVVCFQKRTGAVVWKSTRDLAGYAPPVVATLGELPQVIVFTAEGVVGLRRSDGAELWRVPVKTSFARHVTTPVIWRDTVVVSSHQAGLLGIRVRRQGETWAAELAWTNKEAAINYACPVAVGDYLYGLGPAQNLECVEIATGRVAWSQKGLFSSSADKSYAGMIVLGSNLLILADHGEVLLAKARPESYQEIARAQVAAFNWCNPAYADGVLYLRDGLKTGGHWSAVALR